MFQPLRDKILVKPEVRVLSEILYFDNKEVENMGEIVAVGPGEWVKDKFIPNPLKVGDKIRFGTMGNDEYLKYYTYYEGKEKFLIMSWKDVCWVDENDQETRQADSA